jgi:hypothetical protein
MSHLPQTRAVPVVRVEPGGDAVWAALQDEITSPTSEGFLATVEFVDDEALAGLSPADLAEAFPPAYPHDYRHPVVFVVDALTMASPEHPLLVIDLNRRGPSAPFRCTPRAVQSIENNLSLANMDFADYATSVQADGVFRGFA